MRAALVLLALFTTTVSFSQGNHHLSFQAGVGVNSFQMGQISEHYVDNFLAIWDLVDLDESRGINDGRTFRFSVNYHPSSLFDFGVYGIYQNAQQLGRATNVFIGSSGDLNDDIVGIFRLNASAIGVGLTNSWYISQVLNWQESDAKFLRNFHFGIELSAGVAWSMAYIEIDNNSPTYSNYTSYTARPALQSEIGCKTEYSLTKSEIYSALGLRVGYQFFRTAVLQQQYAGSWIVGPNQEPMNLDFSGIYVGAYLRLGS